MIDGDPALEDDEGALEYRILGKAMPSYQARVKAIITERIAEVDALETRLLRSVNEPPSDCRPQFRATLRMLVKNASATERRRLERAERWLTMQPIKDAGKRMIALLNSKTRPHPLSGLDENLEAVGEQAEKLVEKQGSFQVTPVCGEISSNGRSSCLLPMGHSGRCCENYCNERTAVGGQCTREKGHAGGPCIDGRRTVHAAAQNRSEECVLEAECRCSHVRRRHKILAGHALPRGECVDCACEVFQPMPWMENGTPSEPSRIAPPMAPWNCPLRQGSPLPESQCDLELCSDCEASPNLCPIPPTRPLTVLTKDVGEPLSCSLHKRYNDDCGGCRSRNVEASVRTEDPPRGVHYSVRDVPVSNGGRRPSKAEAQSIAARLAEQDERRRAIDRIGGEKCGFSTEGGKGGPCRHEPGHKGQCDDGSL
jgi:hypothetical protein